MQSDLLQERKLEDECLFSASRSSGPGGQNVNKVNTKVELRFDIINSIKFSEGEKDILHNKLSHKLNNKGELVIISQYSRSQIRNKEKTIEKLYLLLNNVLTPKKTRIATKPGRKAKEKRLEKKKQHSEQKQLRRKLKGNHY